MLLLASRSGRLWMRCWLSSPNIWHRRNKRQPVDRDQLPAYLYHRRYIHRLDFRLETIRGFFANKGIPVLDTALIDQHAGLPVAQKRKRSVYRKLWVLILVLVGLSVILYVLPPTANRAGWLLYEP